MLLQERRFPQPGEVSALSFTILLIIGGKIISIIGATMFIIGVTIIKIVFAKIGSVTMRLGKLEVMRL